MHKADASAISSDGQILARSLQKFNNLHSNGDQGITSAKIEDPEQFKDLFCQSLNELKIDKSIHQHIVQKPSHHRHHHFQLDPNVRPPPQCAMHMAWEREFGDGQQHQQQKEHPQQLEKRAAELIKYSWGIRPSFANGSAE
ncbi:hypothetical protein BGZ83_011903 [Gryganskiella cystojenkinii]|nr:hypothetical protein BGZ83_011903 [Gryganskiella cystojenkinii]